MFLIFFCEIGKILLYNDSKGNILNLRLNKLKNIQYEYSNGWGMAISRKSNLTFKKGGQSTKIFHERSA